MGLAIGVGMLADLKANDAEGAAWFSDQLAQLNEVLRDHGRPPHVEPTALPPAAGRGGISSFPYSFLHYLRRAYACVVEGEPVRDGELTEADDVFIMDVTVTLMDSHLLSHSDCEGFYVPQVLDGPICDDRVPGSFLGSSQGLMAELIRVAPALGIELTPEALAELEAVGDGDRHFRERIVWLRLFVCARDSIEYGTLIVFH